MDFPVLQQLNNLKNVLNTSRCLNYPVNCQFKFHITMKLKKLLKKETAQLSLSIT